MLTKLSTRQSTCKRFRVGSVKCPVNKPSVQTFQPSGFDRETRSLGCQLTALPLNLMVNQKALKLPNNMRRYEGISALRKKQQKSATKVKNTLKQIMCSCFYLTHIFEVSRSEVLISRFFWAFFQNLQIWM